MVKIRTTILVLGVVALCAVTIASPLGKPADSSSEESGETGEFMKELQEMCRNNSGSDMAFLQLLESFQTMMMCSVSAIDMEAFVTELDALSNETRTTFFPRYCPQLRTTYGCVESLVNDVRPCLEEDDYTIVKALVGILPDAVDLLCKNDGDILFKFDEPKYTECFEKISDSFDECLTFLNGTDDWDISHMTRDQCGDLTGFRQCLQDKMNICKAPDLISVYDLFHNTLFRMTPCRNYVEIQKVTVVDNNDLNEI
ncbi:27 kDa glycoprotein-like [Anopheles marshallii]|uniref:27 kDa glycoprotein-like n=1 Tax=Anopheles marshallii TaxID=1521116 RepID=UPI00237BE537|nr:27 kDa glycoprotein-like [Anopheles marshallii]